ncbi:MAG TPA: fatty acid desaturase [Pyrinomonadaceae bacterium]|nr:fatty acid desaturase [Pyrinomonadaceae bacterium]
MIEINNNPDRSATFHGQGPIAVKVSPFARRLQRGIAFGVVVLPLVGFIVAMIQLWKYGISVVDVALLAVMYVVTIIGETVGYHRHFAHRAFDTSKTMRAILAILGSMTAQGPIVFWVAVHRRHHAYSDREGDPHSPNLHGKGLSGLVRGLWHGHIGWMFTDEQTSWARFAREILQDRTIFKIHQQYFFWLAMGLVIPALLGGLITKTMFGAFSGFLWGGLVRIFLVNQAMWCVGSICHRFGRNPFRTHDHSGNVYWVALLSFGEGLQNNHHAFPNSARHGLKWWEPDFSGWVIRSMETLGLIWNVKHPSAQAIRNSRQPTVHTAQATYFE